MNTEIVENVPACIERVQIEALWNNPAINIDWKLNRNVNILAGGNGSGKTTVLKIFFNIMVAAFAALEESDPKKNLDFNDKYFHKFNSANFQFLNKNFKIQRDTKGLEMLIPEFTSVSIKLSYVNSVNLGLLPHELIQKIDNPNVRTVLDYQVHICEQSYKDYQILLGRKYRLPNANFVQLSEKINLFYSLINQHFKETNKTIDTEATGFAFKLGDKKFDFTELSSGEKQILCILNTALIQSEESCIFILDEPEVSLHTDWQENLIDNILLLNPNAQIIIATHSPSIIMNKWGNPKYITQMDKITFPTLENIN